MIRYIRLATGQELVGEQVSQSKTSLTLRKPMILEIVPHEGMAVFSLMSYTAVAENMEFNTKYIMQLAEASGPFAEMWKKRNESAPLAVEGPDDFVSDEGEMRDDETVELEEAVNRATIH